LARRASAHHENCAVASAALLLDSVVVASLLLPSVVGTKTATLCRQRKQ
jgi:hypothetical protein